MDSPSRIVSQPPRLLLSPCSGGRRSSDSNSPEFEFWMLQNPSFPEPNLLSADELFVDGVLLPLHLLPLHNHRPHPPDPQPPNSLPDFEPQLELGPQISYETIAAESAAPLTASKRWKDIFKKSDKKTATAQNQEDKEKEKDKKREKKSQSGATSGAELNINIWPFARSRSEGNSASRPRMFPGAPGARKVSSAPCSRSNSAGESKSRKWPTSPGRGGVHLGRSSPVWQVRRGAAGGWSSKSVYSEPVSRNSEKGMSKKVTDRPRKTAAGSSSGGGGSKAKVVNLNVPTCIGYRQQLSCRSHESSGIRDCTNGERRNGGSGNSNGNVGSGGHFFNLRSLFTKKVY
ncbi:hypothetical protein JCGZ_21166 [Jatropha curcas]|uniref:Uncharacterized protein n=1 Tax=Jatropha curcas TaxID=180498 RepID=A0A067JL21_JATCU|nr:hypothetical protein JCGZ_21166 [Jatropha curcas]